MQTAADRNAGVQRAALVAVLALAAFLNLYHLDQIGPNGLGNTYYAAAVQSMLTDWRHFFYLSFDPAGFLALDKAPLAIWLQAGSAALFGFHGWSLLLPQAFAGILTVALLYHLVRRTHGRWAGLLAALALAVTPASVVTNRNNTPDALLILVLLLAAWAMLRAVERGAPGWLLASAALVGAAFNVKMLQILLALPALAALYCFCAPLPWRKRLLYAALAAAVGLVVASPWVLAVELTPPDQRPYVGGSATNSLLELIFNYNGVARLWGEDWTVWLGAPGPLRLFNDKLAGQISWLLPFVIIGLPFAAAKARTASRRGALILWSVWLIFPLLYFSASLFYHSYYLATMAPAVAALTGIGADALWTARQSAGWRKWGAAAALAAGAGVQALILLPYPYPALIASVLGLCLAALLLMQRAQRTRRGAAAFATGCLALLIAPAVWALIPALTCTHSVLPAGGPQPDACKPFEIKPLLDPALVAYLEDNRGGARYLAATYDLGISAFGILATGEPFMTLGGYRGTDPILSVGEFAQFVADGEVRIFLSLTEEAELPEHAAIRRWVDAHCPLAPIQPDGITVRGPCAEEVLN
ncbi:MAG: glycosyltransferase family 39 protein [Anaerolineae bacterium]|nr:glycosyltransferase family 39 protein [Anaerolineae bacterium]